MTVPSIAPALEAVLAAAQAGLAERVAAAVPDDVAVAVAGYDIRLTGRGLARRALVDPRLRDFAGLLR